jgi:hypothetical protein
VSDLRSSGSRAGRRGPLLKKLEKISKTRAVCEKSKGEKRRAREGVKRAMASGAQLRRPSKKVRFATDDALVSFAPPARPAPANTAGSQQETLQLLSDARAQAEKIAGLPSKTARARELSSLLSGLSDCILASAGTSRVLTWSLASRKLALIAFCHGNGTLTGAAGNGEASMFASELKLIAECIAEPDMLQEYWQVEILEIVVANVCANALLLDARHFDVAAARACVALDSLCEGAESSVAVSHALEALIDKWADLDADLDKLCTQFHSLITTVATRIFELGTGCVMAAMLLRG